MGLTSLLEGSLVLVLRFIVNLGLSQDSEAGRLAIVEIVSVLEDMRGRRAWLSWCKVSRACGEDYGDCVVQ